MTPPNSFIREKPGVYWVLAEYKPSKPPKKNPDQMWEVRTSQRDEKTYCTCPDWPRRLHRGDGEAVCKHIARFRQEQPTRKIVIMDKEGFLMVQRSSALILGATAATQPLSSSPRPWGSIA